MKTSPHLSNRTYSTGHLETSSHGNGTLRGRVWRTSLTAALDRRSPLRAQAAVQEVQCPTCRYSAQWFRPLLCSNTNNHRDTSTLYSSNNQFNNTLSPSHCVTGLENRIQLQNWTSRNGSAEMLPVLSVQLKPQGLDGNFPPQKPAENSGWEPACWRLVVLPP